MDWHEEFLAVEAEREIAKSNQNQSETNVAPETKGCACTSILISLVASVIIWRFILEIISLISTR